ncbi:helix-turn-helix transcriptional regulator [Paenibacillus eucommiae]|uniref:AraC-like DNA-binding protein n=1 Tax=Paenibacillus eucommiae TaxID=1355755 RepID=A0ABS4J6T9_9BACL|nr:AraC family transcriptional regulator [Paenibacillus eucommiae]MBP1995547.1 AraC-like DNA-binding protein [Paenibacillus eucommiae]
MPSTIRIKDIHEYFGRFSEHIDGKVLNKDGQQQVQLAPSFGVGTITRIPIREGMEIIISDMKLEQDLKLNFQGSYHLFELNYCLDGDIYCSWDGKDHHTGNQNGNVCYLENMKLYMEKKGGIRTRTLEIRLSPDELMRYVNGTTDQHVMEKLLLQYKGRIGSYANSPLIQKCVLELFYCTEWGAMKRLYAESKAMELIALIGHEGEKASGELSISLSADDIKKLQEARNRVMSFIEQPLSIRELAKHVGINEYKLKKGFRELFGLTIFELVRTERMKKALDLMENEGFNVGETAIELGYSNMSNFTLAFRKQYGLNPGQYIAQLNRRPKL